jgi:hypothetical protein
MRLPFEQLLFQLRLQRLDLPAQCRLRQEDLLRRPADIALLGDRHKIAQLTQLHGVSLRKPPRLEKPP